GSWSVRRKAEEDHPPGRSVRRLACRGSQAWTWRGALENGELVPQREVLEHQEALGPDPAKEACEEEGDHAGHHRSGRPEVNVDETDGVSRRHRLRPPLRVASRTPCPSYRSPSGSGPACRYLAPPRTSWLPPSPVRRYLDPNELSWAPACPRTRVRRGTHLTRASAPRRIGRLMTPAIPRTPFPLLSGSAG